MADNVAITAGAGTTIATDDVGGVHYQIVKVAVGALDAAALISNTNPVPTRDAFDGTLLATAVSVTTSATALPASPASGRRAILVQNLSTANVFLGGSGVTTASGVKIGPEGSVEIKLGAGLLYGIVGTGTADVRVLEFA